MFLSVRDKMMLLQLVLQLLLLSNVHVQKAVAQLCPSVDLRLTDKFFEVLRNVESQGQLCKINVTASKIGPYQISKAYYENALSFNEDLEKPGKSTVRVK